MTSFAAATLDLERRLVAPLALAPLALAPELARAAGTWKGAPAVIETRAWRGGPVAYARVTRVWQPERADGGGLEIANLLALGAPGYGLPVLGVDLVSLGGTGARSRIAVADCSPTIAPGAAREAQLAGMARAAAERPAMMPGDPLPGWCARFFSPHALNARPRPGEHAAAVTAAARVVDEFAALAQGAADSRSLGTPRLVRDARRRQLAYLAAHRDEDRGLRMLATIFGADWAARFVAEVLFPDRLPERPVEW